MITMAFEDLIDSALRAVLQGTHPDVEIMSAVDNTTIEVFPALIYEVSARENDLFQKGWETRKEMVWEMDLTLNLLAEASEIGQLMLDVHEAVKQLEFRTLYDEATGEPIVSFERFTTTLFFSAAGQSPITGGKLLSQKSGSYSIQLKETRNGSRTR